MSPDPNRDVTANDLEIQQSPGSRKAGWIIGGGLLVVLLALVILIPNPSDRQCVIIQFLMSVDAAFLSVFFIGGLTISGTVSKMALKAGGGFAVFVLMQFFFDPFQLQTAVADAAPNLIPPSREVRAAQRELSTRGEYSGPINGRLTSKTREAIKAVQSRNNLEIDGRLDKQTKQLIMSQ